MIRFFRPLVVVTSFALLASPALAQSRSTRDAVERAAGTLDPNIPAQQQGRRANGRWGGPSTTVNGRWGRASSSTANGTYGSGTYDKGSARGRDDDDRDEDNDGDGPGRNGRGHAYGHYKHRNENEGNYGNTCLDNNRNGICDNAERNGGYNGGYNNGGYNNGGYNNGAYSTYPSSLPDMIGAVMGSRGQLSADASRWLGNGSYSAQTTRARNGRIAQASWYDRSGSMVQRWVDQNLDGRADLVQIFRNGQLVRTVTR